MLTASQIATLAADTQVPSTPGSVMATAASSSQINLTWSASTDSVGVTGYRVSRCSGAACTNFVSIATPTGTSYSDSGLTASTSYSYQVRAIDAQSFNSSYSTTATTTTQATGGDTTPPTVPTGLSSTATSSSQINLSWTASTDNVGVTGYRVESCSGASCTTFAQIGTPTTTTYSATGLTASTSYSFRVRATDAAGNLSGYSSTSSATTQTAADTTPPTAPTGLSAAAASSSQINLSWTASTDNVGVTGYRVESCSGVSCTTFAQIGTSTATAYSVTGLTPSTSYSFRLRAIDAAGNLSGYSGTSSATTAADTTPPTASGTPTLTVVSSSQINLSWSASSDNVGVTGYRVERCQGASCTTFTQIGTPTSTSYSDSGLTSSTSYSYRVRATDAAGNLSSYSGTASATTSTGTNSNPRAYWPLDETSGTSTADATGNGNTGTLINGATWTTGKIGNAVSLPNSNSMVSVNASAGLSNLYTTGMTVSAWIKPNSAGGNGRGYIIGDGNGSNGWFVDMLSSSSILFGADTYATAPTNRQSTSAITLGVWQHIAVTWDGSTNGANIHLYVNGVSADSTSTVGSGTAQNDSTLPFGIGNAPDILARQFDGLIDDVRIYNQVLTASQVATLAGDTQVPSAPGSVTATAVSSSQINLSWSASTDTAGVTGYRVTRCSGAACTNFTSIATPTGTSYSDTGLTASTSYSYQVRATDAQSFNSAYSTTATTATQASGGDTTPPTAPTGLSATAISSSQVNLSWTASTDNVGVTGYRVESCSGASCTTFAQIGTPTTTTYSATGLAGSTSYSFRVRATDAAGNLSSYSSTSIATTQSAADTTPPTAPTGLSPTVASSVQINLTWTASTDNVGVTGYRVERCQGASCATFAQIGTPTVTSYGDSTLTAATSYSYRVRATDAAGNLSGYSSVVSATTGSGTNSYTYDANGHLSTVVTSAGTAYYHYDAAGNVTSITTTP